MNGNILDSHCWGYCPDSMSCCQVLSVTLWLIDWYFISKKCTYINSTYKQIKSSMCMQRYMYHLVAARETTASLSKLAALMLNSLLPSDTLWQHKSGSTLAQVMACCLTATSHCLNRCRFIISKVPSHPSESNFTRYLSHQSLNLAWKLLI